MNPRELLLLALVLWTAIGIIGTLLSVVRHEHARARRGVVWLIAVWALYLAIELGVATTEAPRVIAVGQEQCFDEMCFTVSGLEEIPGFFGRDRAGANAKGDGSRILRISIAVRNKARRGRESEGLIQTYLVDKQGRRWKELPGLTGVPLTTMVAAGNTVVSEPVFKIAADSTGLGLIFTHGRWQPGTLVIGDSDSLAHKPTIVQLER